MASICSFDLSQEERNIIRNTLLSAIHDDKVEWNDETRKFAQSLADKIERPDKLPF